MYEYFYTEYEMVVQYELFFFALSYLVKLQDCSSRHVEYWCTRDHPPTGVYISMLGKTTLTINCGAVLSTATTTA